MSPNIKHQRNATIYQNRQTGLSYDPSKGHDVPVYETVAVAAVLESTGYPPKDLAPPQVENATIQWYRGYSETSLNPNYRQVVEATISGVKGRLHLEPITQDPAIHKFKFAKLTGYPCQGWFQLGGRIN